MMAGPGNWNDLRLGVNIDHVATIRNARGGGHPDPLRAARIAAQAGAEAITLTYLLANPLDFLFPMLVGTTPTGVLVWFVFFWPLRRMVESYQAHRRDRLARKAVSQGTMGGSS